MAFFDVLISTKKLFTCIAHFKELLVGVNLFGFLLNGRGGFITSSDQYGGDWDLAGDVICDSAGSLRCEFLLTVYRYLMA